MRKPNRPSAWYWIAALLLGLTPLQRLWSEVPRVLPAGQLPDDRRLQPLKDLDGFFPLEVPAGKDAWEARAAQQRRRILVATGLWPLPPRTPLQPVITGRPAAW